MCHEQGTYTSHEDGREKLWIVVAEMNMIIDDVVTLLLQEQLEHRLRLLLRYPLML